MTQPIIKQDIEARIKDTGDTMTGNLMITNQTYPKVSFKPNTSGYSWIEGNEKGTSVISQLAYGDIGYRALRIANTDTDVSSSIQIVEKTDNAIFTTYTLLHTGNKNLITYTDVGAVKYEKIVGNNIDFDPLLTTGIYSIYGSNNGPVAGSHGTLYVDADVGTKYQVWTLDNQARVWKRWWDNTNQVWRAWTDVWNISATKDGNGNVIASTYLPLTGGTISGNLQVNGYLRVGGNADGSNNYIAFYGTTQDGPGGYTHTLIGENIYETPEKAELIIFKGNDIYTSASGPDRIRHISSQHLFQTYSGSALGGSFESICNSTLPTTIFEINPNGVNIIGTISQNGTNIDSLYLKTSGGILSGSLTFANNTWNLVGDDCSFGDVNIAGAFALKGNNGATQLRFIQYGGTAAASLTWDGTKLTSSALLYGAVWNDYAEFREYNDSAEPPYGRVVIENGDDTLSLSTERLQRGGNICSDTFGFAIGETDQCKMPIAVAGRALVYTYEDRNTYQPGEALCTGPNGTVSRMTREEIKKYPDCIIGYVSAIPTYEHWGTGNVEVNGRIWISIK